MASDTAPGTLAYNIPTANVVATNRDDSFGLTIQQDGKYVIAGAAQNSSGTTNPQVYVGRILTSGALDAAFDTNGLDGTLDAFVVTQIVGGASSERSWDVAMAPDGKIVAAGKANGSDILVVRYQSGQLVAEAGGPYVINEPGGSVVLAGSAVGAGTLTYLWDLDNDGIFGEAAGPGLYGNENGATPTFSVAGVDGPTVFPVKLRVLSDLNGDLITDQTSEDTATVTVVNVAPTAALANGGAVNEGSTGSVSFSGQFDPSPADTTAGFRYSYDFNNDGVWEVGNGSYGGSVAADSQVVPASFLADGAASYTIKARILDDDGGFTDYTTIISVNNVAPTLTISGAANVNEGAIYTLNLSSSDPGTDTITSWTINWGDGTQVVTGNPSSVTHTYADGPNSYTISATATDEDGTFGWQHGLGDGPQRRPDAHDQRRGRRQRRRDLHAEPVVVRSGHRHDHQLDDQLGRRHAKSSPAIRRASRTRTPTATTTTRSAPRPPTRTARSRPATRLRVTVHNVAPTLTISGAASVNEGALYTLNLSSTDPGTDTITSWTINWGDGTRSRLAAIRRA